MPEKYIRVRDKVTGHQYDIFPSQFNENAHVKLKRFPPVVRPRAPKHNVIHTAKPAEKAKTSE